MKKYQILYTVGGRELTIVREANDRDSLLAEYKTKESDDTKIIDVRLYAGLLDEKIRKHIETIKIELPYVDPMRLTQVKERLRCCADAAYMFGESSQESLERTLGRLVDCDDVITGLDSHMFSFGFKSPRGGYWGGIIFHCNAKEWSAHT